MKMKMMRRPSSFLVFLLCSTFSNAQINLPAGGTYSQDFDKMSKTATASLPSGWRVGSNTSPRVVGSFLSAGAATTQKGGASMASNAAAGIYNFGAGDPDDATDRALGGLASGSAYKTVTIFVDLYNSGSDTIGSYTVSYDVEKYRNGSNSFGFNVELWRSLNGTSWTHTGLITNFTKDANNSGAVTVPIETKSVVSKTLTLITAVPPKTHFYLAWTYSVNSDDNSASTANAQALGIDNVIVSAKAKASLPSLKAEAVQDMGKICLGAISASSSKLTGTRLDGSAVVVGPLGGYSFAARSAGPFSSTLSLSYEGNSLDTTFYVRLSPTEVKSYAGNIPIAGGGVGPITVAVSGTGINTSPDVKTGEASAISDNSATLAGRIISSGCSPVAAYGIEYGLSDGFTIGAGTVVGGKDLNAGDFIADLKDLSAATTYFYRSFAVNNAGKTYGEQKSFTTTTVHQPEKPLKVEAIDATDVTLSGFTANWRLAQGEALNYRLDVSTNSDFIDDHTSAKVANWTFPSSSADGVVDTANSVNGGKTISTVGANNPTFASTGATSNAARATGWSEGSGLKYWQVELNTTGSQNLLLSSKQRSSSTGPKEFKIQYKKGATGAWTDVPASTITVADNFTTGSVINKPLPEECNNQPSVFLRWIMTSNISVGGGSVGSTGASLIDDILVTGYVNTYVPGYKDLLVKDTFSAVTGLLSNAAYFYRVRAFDGNALSANSNIIKVSTTKQDEPDPDPEIQTPATLMDFTGIRQNDKNVLRWTTAIESNNSGFDLQRSEDSVHYYSVGFIPSAAFAGNSKDPIDYSFNDYDIAGDAQYYRLKLTGSDGLSMYSDTVSIRDNKTPALKIVSLYPNPASGSATLVIEAPVAERVICSIISIRGNIYKQSVYDVSVGRNNFSLDLTGLSPGTYHVKCMRSSGVIITQKLVVR